MAYKSIHDTFWTDPILKKKYQPIERYLYLYFITNPHAHYTGLYYLPKSIIKDETGLSEEDINRCMDTLIDTPMDTLMDTPIQKNSYPICSKKIMYDHERDIIFVCNMLKYQVKDAKLNKKQLKGLKQYFKKLHKTPLIKEFFKKWSHLKIDTPMDTPINRGMDTLIDTLTVGRNSNRNRNSNNNNKRKNNKKEIIKEIISDLNLKSKKKYRETKNTKKLILARLKEGFTFEDFQKVHTNMCEKWLNDPKMNQYLRPSTLYRAQKFESYLNIRPSISSSGLVSDKTEKSLNIIEQFIQEENNNAEQKSI